MPSKPLPPSSQPASLPSTGTYEAVLSVGSRAHCRILWCREEGAPICRCGPPPGSSHLCSYVQFLPRVPADQVLHMQVPYPRTVHEHRLRQARPCSRQTRPRRRTGRGRGAARACRGRAASRQHEEVGCPLQQQHRAPTAVWFMALFAVCGG